MIRSLSHRFLVVLSVALVANETSFGQGTVYSVNIVGCVPGDMDQDRRLSLSDSLSLLYILQGDAPLPGCLDVADVNRDRQIDASDATLLLNQVFGLSPVGGPGAGLATCGIPDAEAVVASMDDWESPVEVAISSAVGANGQSRLVIAVELKDMASGVLPSGDPGLVAIVPDSWVDATGSEPVIATHSATLVRFDRLVAGKRVSGFLALADDLSLAALRLTSGGAPGADLHVRVGTDVHVQALVRPGMSGWGMAVLVD